MYLLLFVPKFYQDEFMESRMMGNYHIRFGKGVYICCETAEVVGNREHFEEPQSIKGLFFVIVAL